jgi:hypothetical protein
MREAFSVFSVTSKLRVLISARDTEATALSRLHLILSLPISNISNAIFSDEHRIVEKTNDVY